VYEATDVVNEVLQSDLVRALTIPIVRTIGRPVQEASFRLPSKRTSDLRIETLIPRPA
jgi:hypothetical protein